MQFRDPIEKEIDGKTYILSKFPAVAGREIVCKYPLSGLPKLGDYGVNEETMFKLMKYVAVKLPDGKQLALENRALIDNHIDSWETLTKIEYAMMEYNCSFFRNGRILSFFEDFVQKLPQWISKMWTGLSEQSSEQDKLIGSANQKEAIMANLQKRAPNFID